MVLLGNPHQYIDGVEKVRGQAMYTDDYKLPNMLYLTFCEVLSPTQKLNHWTFQALSLIPA